ncbi:uncharacterized protein BT62DRAFT_925337 [Guyanagaster necrorhizus]|uniref:Uncharacterized protein n=1 Tax=Guyanagaster necrorhizus TaxID=856835 RepID=A0A9P8B087_9AGAR|nr:uncharacterized protein BT62DRAFT_925337 [Guyanagaster necrorhizus MCA 3950]KAG7452797.1 hypothetical protein BT62DRAFT_925337 [Guyanagaster necrorhizus MCA 3950]
MALWFLQLKHHGATRTLGNLDLLQTSRNDLDDLPWTHISLKLSLGSAPSVTNALTCHYLSGC